MTTARVGSGLVEASGQQHRQREEGKQHASCLERHPLSSAPTWLSCKTAAACFHFCVTDKHRSETASPKASGSAPLTIGTGQMGFAGKFWPYWHGTENTNSEDQGWVWPRQSCLVGRSAAGRSGETDSICQRSAIPCLPSAFFKGSVIRKIASNCRWERHSGHGWY